MKIGEAKKITDKYFGDLLRPIRFKKYRHGFIKEESDFFIYFSYALFDSDNSFQCQFGLSCGFRSFDKIMSLVLGRIIEKGALFSLSQAVLYDERKYPKVEYELYAESDIKAMVKEVGDFIEKEALPLFENLNTITKLEDIRNQNPIPQQALTGLILAKVVANPNYDSLKSRYRQLLKDWPESDKQELERVIVFLDQHSREELLKIAESQA